MPLVTRLISASCLKYTQLRFATVSRKTIILNLNMFDFKLYRKEGDITLQDIHDFLACSFMALVWPLIPVLFLLSWIVVDCVRYISMPN